MLNEPVVPLACQAAGKSYRREKYACMCVASRCMRDAFSSVHELARLVPEREQ
jgi:hypothetical protein